MGRSRGPLQKEHLFVGAHDPPNGPAEPPGNHDLAAFSQETAESLPHPPRFEPTPSRDKGVGSWSRVPTGLISSVGAASGMVRLVIPARDLNKGQEVKERIQKECPNAEIILLEIDLSSFASVKRICYEFFSLELPLNLLM
ncbi:hypothetical protein Scep_020464 [Stephania cephalantha]|uniref:Uncharacterized protein n=1 Tax=Stephania cephalantha TaxID=152367 RepID=A0AAP0NPA5_9MAGN